MIMTYAADAIAPGIPAPTKCLLLDMLYDAGAGAGHDAVSDPAMHPGDGGGRVLLWACGTSPTASRDHAAHERIFDVTAFLRRPGNWRARPRRAPGRACAPTPSRMRSQKGSSPPPTALARSGCLPRLAPAAQ